MKYPEIVLLKERKSGLVRLHPVTLDVVYLRENNIIETVMRSMIAYNIRTGEKEYSTT